MIYSRGVSNFFVILLLSAIALAAVAQSNSSRRSGVQAPQGNINTPAKDTDAEMYEKAKANAESMYAKMVKDYEEKYIPALIQSELAYTKIMFKEKNGREPNSEELQVMQIDAEKKAQQEQEKALKAQRDGMAKSLARYAAYQKDMKEKQQAKIKKMKDDHEALGLPDDLDGMFVVMSNGMVFRVINRSDQDQLYPYKLYAVRLSGLSREAGRSVGDMMAKARYNYRTLSFDYREALDYTKAFDIPLNYELVKQGCGTIYGDDISFKFQIPNSQTDVITQWNATSQGVICPYVNMDYANCRIKRCLKRIAYNETITVLKDPSAAMALGKDYFDKTEKTRKSFAERKAELADIVSEVNAKAKRKERQEARTKCPRALCEDTVINQFIIDQAWGRAPNEKPVF